ncbi:MAG: hypothetical protein ACYSWU_16655, partial [Planctomycetota bacterium]
MKSRQQTSRGPSGPALLVVIVGGVSLAVAACAGNVAESVTASAHSAPAQSSRPEASTHTETAPSVASKAEVPVTDSGGRERAGRVTAAGPDPVL